MSLNRRNFMRTLGIGAAGGLTTLVAGRGSEAYAGYWPATPTLADVVAGGAPIRIDTNENPYGPAPEALEGILKAFSEAGRYPDNPDELTDRLAEIHGVKPENVVLGCGSGEILSMATTAFTSDTLPLVTGLPSYETPTRTAELLKRPIHAVPVDADLKLDLTAMAEKAQGAGLVFLCNPNNPTGTVHPSDKVTAFIERVVKSSPDTYILVDEAYHHYVQDPGYASSMPLVMQHPKVFMVRTFSKIYGMAGLRLGYAVGHTDTIATMRRFKLANNINVLAAAAALGSLGLTQHLDRQRQLNQEARELTTRAFESAGYTVTPSHTNFVMVDIRRDVREFATQCRQNGVLVGRPFPPLTTQARISMGTLDEMQRAVDVFRKVLGVTTTASVR